jgi:hypothetical protein
MAFVCMILYMQITLDGLLLRPLVPLSLYMSLVVLVPQHN